MTVLWQVLHEMEEDKSEKEIRCVIFGGLSETIYNSLFMYQGGLWADFETTAARLGLQVLENFFFWWDF